MVLGKGLAKKLMQIRVQFQNPSSFIELPLSDDEWV